MNNPTTQASRFLSLILRHKPEEVGLTLDTNGWCSVSDLLKALPKHGRFLSQDELDFLVESNDKKRFEFSPDGKRIRAVQGHSVEVKLMYDAIEPPEILFHGTATRFLDSIKASGIVKGSRQQVHLSDRIPTALKVGQRHGSPVVIPVSARVMHKDGLLFYKAPNGVWLTDEVPARYLRFDGLIHSYSVI